MYILRFCYNNQIQTNSEDQDKLVAHETLVFNAYVLILTCRSIYLQHYLQELSNLTGCIMETLHFSYVYADRDGYDKCMRSGSLKTSLPARLYIYMYYIHNNFLI